MIVSSTQIVTRAKMRLRLMETSEHDLEILKLIEEGARGLNASSTYKISCHEAEIDCNKAKLPDCYESLEYFCVNGCCGNCTSPPETIPPTPVVCSCPSVFYFSKSALINSGCDDNSCGWYGNYFYIQNGYIYFSSTVTATSLKIWYVGFNVDENGLMVINEECERGLSAYAAFQFASSRPEAYQSQIGLWNAEWVAQKRYINGKKIIREFKLQKADISLLVNATMAQNRRAGLGRYGGTN